MSANTQFGDLTHYRIEVASNMFHIADGGRRESALRRLDKSKNYNLFW